MTNAALTAQRDLPRLAPLSPIDRAAKRAVLARLARLRTGRLEITDAAGTVSLGADAPDHDLHAAVVVRDPRFYRRAALHGALGVASSYIDGYWTTGELTRMLRLFARDMTAAHDLQRGTARYAQPLRRLYHTLRRNTRRGSRRNIAEHYDLGNDFFSLFLDESMTYSAGIFPTPESSLEAAQFEKLDRICRRLDLAPSDHVVEIGSGWGGFAIHAAGRYGCRVTTTTISREQHAFATRRIREAGLDYRVEVLLRDYRDLRGTYDKLVSIEMIEAVGHDFLPAYFAACSDLLRPQGTMSIQAITMPDSRYAAYRRTTDFIQRYVFPGSCCPSMGAIADAVAKVPALRLLRTEDITLHYAHTIAHWSQRFADNAAAVQELGYPERFIRLWNYYLSYCQAGFAERYIGVSQLLYCKHAAPQPVSETQAP